MFLLCFFCGRTQVFVVAKILAKLDQLGVPRDVFLLVMKLPAMSCAFSQLEGRIQHFVVKLQQGSSLNPLHRPQTRFDNVASALT